jgi:hypothetical protein
VNVPFQKSEEETEAVKYRRALQLVEMTSKVPSWIEHVLLPQLMDLKGEIKALGVRTEGEFKIVHSEIKRLDEKIDGLDKRMDITQRLVVVEGRVHELQAKK